MSTKNIVKGALALLACLLTFGVGAQAEVTCQNVSVVEDPSGNVGITFFDNYNVYFAQKANGDVEITVMAQSPLGEEIEVQRRTVTSGAGQILVKVFAMDPQTFAISGNDLLSAAVVLSPSRTISGVTGRNYSYAAQMKDAVLISSPSPDSGYSCSPARSSTDLIGNQDPSVNSNVIMVDSSLQDAARNYNLLVNENQNLRNRITQLENALRDAMDQIARLANQLSLLSDRPKTILSRLTRAIRRLEFVSLVHHDSKRAKRIRRKINKAHRANLSQGDEVAKFTLRNKSN